MPIAFLFQQQNGSIGPIDIAGSASAAYSVSRRLSRSYGGSLIRVRRASDNVEQDFSFDTAGNLDTAAIATFIAATTGAIVTVYDQSGAGLHITKSTASAQPAYVASGVNGRAVGRFVSASSQELVTGAVAVLKNVAGGSQFVVAKLSATGAGTVKSPFSVSNNVLGTSRLGFFFDRAAGKFEGGGRRLDADSFVAIVGGNVDTNWHVHSQFADYAGAKGYLFTDGTLAATVDPFQTAGSTSNTDSGAIGFGSSAGSTYFPGDISEGVVYDRLLTAAEHLAIERNQGAYYGITVA
jgi:hypothetical protein